MTVEAPAEKKKLRDAVRHLIRLYQYTAPGHPMRKDQYMAVKALENILNEPDPVDPRNLYHYAGTCDACGEDITLEHDNTQGLLDHWVDEKGAGTWIRHIGGPKPDCNLISSRVRML